MAELKECDAEPIPGSVLEEKEDGVARSLMVIDDGAYGDCNCLGRNPSPRTDGKGLDETNQEIRKLSRSDTVTKIHARAATFSTDAREQDRQSMRTDRFHT